MAKEKRTHTTIFDLTEKEWDEILLLGARLKRAGQFNGERDKCMIYAVCQWLADRDINVMVQWDPPAAETDYH